MLVKFLALFFFILTMASVIYWLVAGWQVKTFFRKERKKTGFTPPVSILKPVKGLDVDAYENFASFCRQDYPEYEILFGVADPEDPVLGVIRRLQRDFPSRSIRCFIMDVDSKNQKTELLDSLFAQVSYDYLAISDSDTQVSPDYLKRVVEPLVDPSVGMVTCPYRGVKAETYTARLEALHMGVTFLPSTLVASQLMEFPFGMGSTEVVRKRDIERMGGFASMADYLADDYQLAVRLFRLGLRVYLSDYIVNIVLGSTSFKDQWRREVRWAHCNRASRPKEYPGLLLTYSTPLAALFALAYYPGILGLGVLAGVILLRYSVAYYITSYTGDHSSRQWLFWLPVREMLSGLIWFAGLVSRKVVWRNRVYSLIEDGKMVPYRPGTGILWGIPGNFLRAFIILLDKILRRVYGIRTFKDDKDCIFRISVGVNKHPIQLSEQLWIPDGEPVIDLHFWNEHIPSLPASGPDLAWALTFQKRLRHSMEALAVYVDKDPNLTDIRFYHGAPPFQGNGNQVFWKDAMQRWGFRVAPVQPNHTFQSRFAHFWESVYAAALLYAYNPASLGSRKWNEIEHIQIWMTREDVFQHYRKDALSITK